MEKYLPFILIIGSFVYKLYTNYKEEMQKAAKRKPHAPINIPTLPHIERKEISNPFKNKDLISTEPKIIKEKYISMEEIPYDEVFAAKQRKIDTKNVISPKEIHPKVETDRRKEVIFDLKQAVIQAAILDRPYQ